MSKKFVYLFTEGNGSMRELLGGKGANLAEMTNIGLPVPQGFTISTEACTKYYEDGRMINEEIMAQIMEHVAKLEAITGKKFGDKENPLLVSVRSGARASMPGMMDTILNLGLNEEVVEVLATKSGNPRWAYDCYRRFIQMYSDEAAKLLPSRQILGAVWRYLADQGDRPIQETPICLCRKVVRRAGLEMDTGMLLTCLDIFSEVGLLQLQRMNKYLQIRLLAVDGKADLQQSSTMQRLLHLKES